MQKNFCDICDKEATPSAMTGGVMRKRFSFIKAETPPAPEVWEICESCTNMVWDFVEKKKAELLKNKKSK